MSLTIEEALILLAGATPPPWKLSADGQRITQTSHLTRDVWTIPRTPEDMHLIAHVHDLGDLVRNILTPGPQGEVAALRGALEKLVAHVAQFDYSREPEVLNHPEDDGALRREVWHVVCCVCEQFAYDTAPAGARPEHEVYDYPPVSERPRLNALVIHAPDCPVGTGLAALNSPAQAPLP